jgi:hypothetical protein
MVRQGGWSCIVNTHDTQAHISYMLRLVCENGLARHEGKHHFLVATFYGSPNDLDVARIFRLQRVLELEAGCSLIVTRIKSGCTKVYFSQLEREFVINHSNIRLLIRSKFIEALSQKLGILKIRISKSEANFGNIPRFFEIA